MMRQYAEALALPTARTHIVMGTGLLLALTYLSLPAQESKSEQGIKGHLVSVQWLEKNLKQADLLILDASPSPVHAAGHIAGAVNTDVMTYGVHEIPLKEMEQRFQSWGVSPGKRIVMVDQGGSMLATRLFFDLYYHGYPVNALLILDGGLSKWKEAGLPITKDPTPVPKKGSYRIKEVRESSRVKLPEFLDASGDPANHALVEALGGNWHFGEVVAFDRAGHIPNGILLPSTDFYNADKTFKSPDEIKRMLDYVGVYPKQKIYAYCGGGVAASVPFFALKFMLGYPSVKLYKESEMGWLKDERGLPYWTYDAPNLMREAAWLQSWGGKMMRTYGGSQVSVVDVRPAEAFYQGHVPFAINIPASEFKRGIADLAGLAALLGPAGINASHEAIVVSGSGLTKESALAFVVLEKLGQKRVSILIDSLTRFTHPGYSLTKDTTLIGPKKNLGDVAVPHTTYPIHLRDDVIIKDAGHTQGLYPKVFIASGPTVSSRAIGGTVIHVPYTDLLTGDGKPKAAKDIWNALVKAGVPRYAELICFSDDPGEAAANYFVLKLMGFPDVKVLAN